MRARGLRRGGLLLTIGVGGLALAAGALALQEKGESRITARIAVPGNPFAVATGEGGVWVLDHPPTGCSSRRRCTVYRIDPATYQVGRRIPMPYHAWDLVVGAGSVWVTQFDGRLIRIDARTGRIVARISARPLYFGSVVTFGGGFVWTGNDDERNTSGSVSKIDPATNEVVGTVDGMISPQSIAFGQGAVWVADHAGWLFKIDPERLEIVARARLRFGPHGVVATNRAVYVADAHGNRLLEADPETAKILRRVRLRVGAIHPAAGAASLWSGSSGVWTDGSVADDRVIRIAEGSLAIVETIHVGGQVPAVDFGFGSVWAAVWDGQIVRVRPG